jgi:hypothetical protein
VILSSAMPNRSDAVSEDGIRVHPNPSPSSGESIANRTFGSASHRRRAPNCVDRERDRDFESAFLLQGVSSEPRGTAKESFGVIPEIDIWRVANLVLNVLDRMPRRCQSIP